MTKNAEKEIINTGDASNGQHLLAKSSEKNQIGDEVDLGNQYRRANGYGYTQYLFVPSVELKIGGHRPQR